MHIKRVKWIVTEVLISQRGFQKDHRVTSSNASTCILAVCVLGKVTDPFTDLPVIDLYTVCFLKRTYTFFVHWKCEVRNFFEAFGKVLYINGSDKVLHNGR